MEVFKMKIDDKALKTIKKKGGFLVIKSVVSNCG